MVLGWTVLWIVIAVLVAEDFRQLTSLSTGIETAGRAMTATVTSLTPLRSIPLVGGQIAPLQQRALAAASAVQANGQAVTTSARQLGLLVGLAIAIAPTVPMIALYAPVRIAQERERRMLRRIIRAGGWNGRLDELLATRAATYLPLDVVLAVPEEGPERVRALADAELRRIGLGAMFQASVKRSGV